MDTSSPEGTAEVQRTPIGQPTWCANCRWSMGQIEIRVSIYGAATAGERVSTSAIIAIMIRAYSLKKSGTTSATFATVIRADSE